jgi:hypothetical protein
MHVCADKKCIRKFRVEQLQSHICIGKGFLIMRKCANISPYMRRPLVIYDLNFLKYEENLIFFFISVPII